MIAPESLTAMKPCVNQAGGLFYTAAIRMRAAVSLAVHDLVMDDVCREALRRQLPAATLIRERLK
jgi:hypothetical protein